MYFLISYEGFSRKRKYNVDRVDLIDNDQGECVTGLDNVAGMNKDAARPSVSGGRTGTVPEVGSWRFSRTALSAGLVSIQGFCICAHLITY